MKGSAKDWQLGVLLAATIGGVALLHYAAPMTHVWVHPLLQRAYYIPILLASSLVRMEGRAGSRSSHRGFLYTSHHFGVEV